MNQISDHPKMDAILKAVRTVLAQKGIAGTTISQISSMAGVSRGLLHYYFKNKDEMITRVIQDNMAIILETVVSIFDKVESARELSTELIDHLRAILYGDPDFFILLFERWTISRQRPEIEKDLKEHHRQFRQAIYQGLNRLSLQKKICPKVALNGLAVLLTGIVDGLGMQLVLDPEMAADENLWETTRQAVFHLLE